MPILPLGSGATPFEQGKFGQGYESAKTKLHELLDAKAAEINEKFSKLALENPENGNAFAEEGQAEFQALLEKDPKIQEVLKSLPPDQQVALKNELKEHYPIKATVMDLVEQAKNAQLPSIMELRGEKKPMKAPPPPLGAGAPGEVTPPAAGAPGAEFDFSKFIEDLFKQLKEQAEGQNAAPPPPPTLGRKGPPPGAELHALADKFQAAKTYGEKLVLYKQIEQEYGSPGEVGGTKKEEEEKKTQAQGNAAKEAEAHAPKHKHKHAKHPKHAKAAPAPPHPPTPPKPAPKPVKGAQAPTTEPDAGVRTPLRTEAPAPAAPAAMPSTPTLGALNDWEWNRITDLIDAAAAYINSSRCTDSAPQKVNANKLFNHIRGSITGYFMKGNPSLDKQGFLEWINTIVRNGDSGTWYGNTSGAVQNWVWQLTGEHNSLLDTYRLAQKWIDKGPSSTLCNVAITMKNKILELFVDPAKCTPKGLSDWFKSDEGFGKVDIYMAFGLVLDTTQSDDVFEARRWIAWMLGEPCGADQNPIDQNWLKPTDMDKKYADVLNIAKAPGTETNICDALLAAMRGWGSKANINLITPKAIEIIRNKALNFAGASPAFKAAFCNVTGASPLEEMRAKVDDWVTASKAKTPPDPKEIALAERLRDTLVAFIPNKTLADLQGWLLNMLTPPGTPGRDIFADTFWNAGPAAQVTFLKFFNASSNLPQKYADAVTWYKTLLDPPSDASKVAAKEFAAKLLQKTANLIKDPNATDANLQSWLKTEFTDKNHDIYWQCACTYGNADALKKLFMDKFGYDIGTIQLMDIQYADAKDYQFKIPTDKPNDKTFWAELIKIMDKLGSSGTIGTLQKEAFTFIQGVGKDLFANASDNAKAGFALLTATRLSDMRKILEGLPEGTEIERTLKRNLLTQLDTLQPPRTVKDFFDIVKRMVNDEHFYCTYVGIRSEALANILKALQIDLVAPKATEMDTALWKALDKRATYQPSSPAAKLFDYFITNIAQLGRNGTTTLAGLTTWASTTGIKSKEFTDAPQETQMAFEDIAGIGLGYLRDYFAKWPAGPEAKEFQKAIIAWLDSYRQTHPAGTISECIVKLKQEFFGKTNFYCFYPGITKDSLTTILNLFNNDLKLGLTAPNPSALDTAYMDARAKVASLPTQQDRDFFATFMLVIQGYGTDTPPKTIDDLKLWVAIIVDNNNPTFSPLFKRMSPAGQIAFATIGGYTLPLKGMYDKAVAWLAAEREGTPAYNIARLFLTQIEGRIFNKTEGTEAKLQLWFTTQFQTRDIYWEHTVGDTDAERIRTKLAEFGITSRITQADRDYVRAKAYQSTIPADKPADIGLWGKLIAEMTKYGSAGDTKKLQEWAIATIRDTTSGFSGVTKATHDLFETLTGTVLEDLRAQVQNMPATKSWELDFKREFLKKIDQLEVPYSLTTIGDFIRKINTEFLAHSVYFLCPGLSDERLGIILKGFNDVLGLEVKLGVPTASALDRSLWQAFDAKDQYKDDTILDLLFKKVWDLINAGQTELTQLKTWAQKVIDGAADVDPAAVAFYKLAGVDAKRIFGNITGTGVLPWDKVIADATAWKDTLIGPLAQYKILGDTLVQLMKDCQRDGQDFAELGRRIYSKLTSSAEADRAFQAAFFSNDASANAIRTAFLKFINTTTPDPSLSLNSALAWLNTETSGSDTFKFVQSLRNQILQICTNPQGSVENIKTWLTAQFAPQDTSPIARDAYWLCWDTKLTASALAQKFTDIAGLSIGAIQDIDSKYIKAKGYEIAASVEARPFWTAFTKYMNDHLGSNFKGALSDEADKFLDEDENMDKYIAAGDVEIGKFRVLVGYTSLSVGPSNNYSDIFKAWASSTDELKFFAKIKKIAKDHAPPIDLATCTPKELLEILNGSSIFGDTDFYKNNTGISRERLENLCGRFSDTISIAEFHIPPIPTPWDKAIAEATAWKDTLIGPLAQYKILGETLVKLMEGLRDGKKDLDLAELGRLIYSKLTSNADADKAFQTAFFSNDASANAIRSAFLKFVNTTASDPSVSLNSALAWLNAETSGSDTFKFVQSLRNQILQICTNPQGSVENIKNWLTTQFAPQVTPPIARDAFWQCWDTKLTPSALADKFKNIAGGFSIGDIQEIDKQYIKAKGYEIAAGVDERPFWTAFTTYMNDHLGSNFKGALSAEADKFLDVEENFEKYIAAGDVEIGKFRDLVGYKLRSVGPANDYSDFFKSWASGTNELKFYAKVKQIAKEHAPPIDLATCTSEELLTILNGSKIFGDTDFYKNNLGITEDRLKNLCARFSDTISIDKFHIPAQGPGPTPTPLEELRDKVTAWIGTLPENLKILGSELLRVINDCIKAPDTKTLAEVGKRILALLIPKTGSPFQTAFYTIDPPRPAIQVADGARLAFFAFIHSEQPPIIAEMFNKGFAWFNTELPGSDTAKFVAKFLNQILIISTDPEAKPDALITWLSSKDCTGDPAKDIYWQCWDTANFNDLIPKLRGMTGIDETVIRAQIPLTAMDTLYKDAKTYQAVIDKLPPPPGADQRVWAALLNGMMGLGSKIDPKSDDFTKMIKNVIGNDFFNAAPATRAEFFKITNSQLIVARILIDKWDAKNPGEIKLREALIGKLGSITEFTKFITDTFKAGMYFDFPGLTEDRLKALFNFINPIFPIATVPSASDMEKKYAEVANTTFPPEKRDQDLKEALLDYIKTTLGTSGKLDALKSWATGFFNNPLFINASDTAKAAFCKLTNSSQLQSAYDVVQAWIQSHGTREPDRSIINLIRPVLIDFMEKGKGMPEFKAWFYDQFFGPGKPDIYMKLGFTREDGATPPVHEVRWWFARIFDFKMVDGEPSEADIPKPSAMDKIYVNVVPNYLSMVRLREPDKSIWEDLSKLIYRLGSNPDMAEFRRQASAIIDKYPNVNDALIASRDLFSQITGVSMLPRVETAISNYLADFKKVADFLKNLSSKERGQIEDLIRNNKWAQLRAKFHNDLDAIKIIEQRGMSLNQFEAVANIFEKALDWIGDHPDATLAQLRAWAEKQKLSDLPQAVRDAFMHLLMMPS